MIASAPPKESFNKMGIICRYRYIALAIISLVVILSFGNLIIGYAAFRNARRGDIVIVGGDSLFDINRGHKPSQYSDNHFQQREKTRDALSTEAAAKKSLVKPQPHPPPKLIVHIGPQLTATSTIQCKLYSLERILRSDNYFYIGAFLPRMAGCTDNNLSRRRRTGINYHKFFTCLIHNKDKPCREQNDNFKRFKDVFHRHKILGRNVIYSSEHLSNLHPDDPEIWDILREIFDGFDVTVIFTYRHHFSWIVSEFNEWVKQIYFVDEWVKGPGQQRRNRSGEIETSIPLISEKIDKLANGAYYSIADLNTNGSSSNPWDTRFHWAKYFGFRYFNLEQAGEEQDVTANFVCQIIPNATKTCDFLKAEISGKADFEEKNGSINLEPDRVAIVSYGKGLIAQNATRNETRYALEPYLNEKKEKGEYPLKCASPHALESLYERSLSILHSTCDYSINEAKMEEDLNKKWSIYVERGNFCDLDAESFVALGNNEIEIKRIFRKQG